jgi:heat shock protein HslJ
MSLVQHLTYDDADMSAPPLLQPGEAFTKSWRLQNVGTCTWDPSYSLVYVGGDPMEGSYVVIHGQTPPNATYDAHVNLVAPTEGGVYQGYWQMRNADGQYFGERIWVGIQVPYPPTATPTVTPTPSAGIEFSVDRTQIRSGECVLFTWNVTNVKATYFYAEGQAWQDNGVPGQSQRQECPQSTTIYYLRVVHADDSVETQEITIHVEQPAQAPQIAAFTIDPAGQIQAGQCVSLGWDVRGNVSKVSILRNDTVLWDAAPVAASIQDCPPGIGQMTYTLEASGPGGTSRAQHTLNVVQASQNPLAGVTWQAITVKGVAPPPGSPPMTAIFSENGMLTGKGACNDYSSNYQVSGNSLTIQPISATQKMCTPEIMTLEQAFFAALQSSATFSVQGGQLIIWDTIGANVLTMGAITATPL